MNAIKPFEPGCMHLEGNSIDVQLRVDHYSKRYTGDGKGLWKNPCFYCAQQTELDRYCNSRTRSGSDEFLTSNPCENVKIEK